MSITMGQLASRLVAAAAKVGPVSDKKLDTLAQVAVGLVKTEIHNAHAVDTGTMINSTTADYVGRSTYLVGPTVFYAPYVALGTKFMAARPFHIKAARKLRPLAKEIFSSDDLGL